MQAEEDQWKSTWEAPKVILWWVEEGFKAEYLGDPQQGKSTGKECQPKQAGVTILLASQVGKAGQNE